MEHVEEQELGAEESERRTITISVNERHVTFHHRIVTGEQIKATAIAQDVQIQPDFVLFEVKGKDPLKQVADDETVRLHEHERFRAVAPDDNSGGEQ